LLNAEKNLNFLSEDPEFSFRGLSPRVEFQEMDWHSKDFPTDLHRCVEKEKEKEKAEILVIANTPWGKRCGHGEAYNSKVVRGIIRKVPAKANLFGFFIPPKTLPVCQELLELHLVVPIGKPAVFVIGSRKNGASSDMHTLSVLHPVHVHVCSELKLHSELSQKKEE
jgi:hypothetical protein